MTAHNIIVLGSLSSSPGMECAVAGFALAGIPLILVAFHGVWNRIESQVRVYFMYLLLTFALDMVFVFREFVFTSACAGLPAAVEAYGAAFACGVMQIANAVIVLLLTGIQAYLIFIIASFCEDLAESGGSANLCDIGLANAAMKREHPHGYHSFLKAHPLGHSMGHGFGQSETIFGGEHHEMNYPPPVTVGRA